jgi:hypothetical protein
MARKQRELTSALQGRAGGRQGPRGVLGGEWYCRPSEGPDAAAASKPRGEAAHRLALDVARLRAEGVVGQAAIARALIERGMPAPSGIGMWTHATVARVPACARRLGAGKDCAVSARHDARLTD